MKCPFCGAEINQELPFCTSCGKQWAEGKTQAKEVPIEQDTKSSEEKVPERKSESSRSSQKTTEPELARSEQVKPEELQPELAEGKESGKESVAPPSKQNTMGRMFSIPVIVLCIILFWPLGIGLLIARIVKQKKIKQSTNDKAEDSPHRKKGTAKKVGIICIVIFILLFVLICALPTRTTTSETVPQQETGEDIDSETQGTEKEENTSVVSEDAAEVSKAVAQSETNEAPDNANSASDYSIQLDFSPLSNQYTFAQQHNIALQNFPELSQVVSWYADMEAQLNDTDNFTMFNEKKICFRILFVTKSHQNTLAFTI